MFYWLDLCYDNVVVHECVYICFQHPEADLECSNGVHETEYMETTLSLMMLSFKSNKFCPYIFSFDYYYVT